MSTIFGICTPRSDVLAGNVHEADFAADLAQVLAGTAAKEYSDPVAFFANTYPTRGLRTLLRSIAARVSGSPNQVGSVFRLDTQFGGGKTHSLIALTHALRGMTGVANAGEFIDLSLLPKDRVRVVAFDGENADPSNGRRMSSNVLAHTPWGELAFQLGGDAAYERIRRSDEDGTAPGAETLRELIVCQPTLILLDELAIYLRKVSARNAQAAAEQLTAFLTGLFKAVESSPRAALVYTLALGKGGSSTDAYGRENQAVSTFMAEAASVSARKATLLDPTEEDETVQVLNRRLFSHIDGKAADAVVTAYQRLWEAHRTALPNGAPLDRWAETFRAGYPLHPELMATLTEKTATLGNFQRVRGMLRLLARTVAELWDKRPADACALHLHHINPGHEPIRQEIVTRLEQGALVPAIRSEVAAHANEPPALAQELDAAHYRGLPPYASYVARATLLHTLAFNDQIKGVTAEDLRFSLLSPGTDISFIDDARKRFVADSAYLDDKPGAPLRFLSQANLTQMIRRQEAQVDPIRARAELNDKVRSIFGGTTLSLCAFPTGAYEVADDPNDGKPTLVVMAFDAVHVRADALKVPQLIEQIWSQRGTQGDPRLNRNSLLFVVAETAQIEAMRKAMVTRLALEELRNPERQRELADYQVAQINERYNKSSQALATAIQQAYRHVFYPSRNKVAGTEADLEHTVIDGATAGDRPGDGQRQVITQLQNVGKLRLPTDTPDSPLYIRDRTPLKKGQITTSKLRQEFYRDPALSMLVGDDLFVRLIRNGIDQDLYLYQNGDLLVGKGDPVALIRIDEQSLVMTTAFAKERGLWPRPAPMAPGAQPASSTASAAPGHPITYGNESNRSTAAVPANEPSPTAGHAARSNLSAEDVLRAALMQVVEKAQRAKVSHIQRLTVRPFEPNDALNLLTVINQPNATVEIDLNVEYETASGSVVTTISKGTPDDARPLREFLVAQLRGAKDKNVSAVYSIQFDPPLALQDETFLKMAERWERIVKGSASISAEPATS